MGVRGGVGGAHKLVVLKLLFSKLDVFKLVAPKLWRGWGVVSTVFGITPLQWAWVGVRGGVGGAHKLVVLKYLVSKFVVLKLVVSKRGRGSAGLFRQYLVSQRFRGCGWE